MTRPTTLVSLLTAAAAVLATFAVPPAGAASIPVPDDDPFYAQPADIASYAPGAVLDSRRVTVLAYVLPIPALAWQIKYRSVENSGRPTANVTTLIVPESPWKGPGARPLVSYQTAEDSAGTQCAPSYGLRTGIMAGYGGAEAGLIAMALAKNWAVVVPDYQGPDSQFLAARTEARGVLDSLKAVRAFEPAGLADSPIGMTGYSGGAVATAFAAQLQGSYAPELPVRGVSLGGVVGEFRPTIKAFSNLGLNGIVMMGVATVSRSYPEMDLTAYLNDAGKALLAEVERDCIAQAQMKYPVGGLNALTVEKNIMDLPRVVDFLHRISPAGVGGVPTAPVFMYHAVFDELALIGPARALFRQYCDAGVRAYKTENLFGEHLSETVVGYPKALAFLASRFAGEPARSNC